MKADKIKITPQWSRSKEQIWAEVFDDLEDKPQVRIIPFYRRKMFVYAAAAVVAVMLMLPAAAFLYSVDVVAPRGEHMAAVLPDGSKITLNAESAISYKPYWWRVNRSVKMSGEVYFEVAKGERFTVVSANGLVSVLGTSFNVQDRGEQYAVTCLTGRVSVESGEQSVILTPGMRSEYANGNLTAATIENPSQEADWKYGKFSFRAAPLRDVITEVERQYNITIKTPANIDYLYTGNFSKDNDPEQVLRIIEKPFGITLTIEK